jgi:hypothetical protein
LKNSAPETPSGNSSSSLVAGSLRPADILTDLSAQGTWAESSTFVVDGTLTGITEALPEERQIDFSYDDSDLRFTYDMLLRKIITQSACSKTTADPFQLIA